MRPTDQLLYLKRECVAQGHVRAAGHRPDDDARERIVVEVEDPVAADPGAPVAGREVELGEELVVGVGIVQLLVADAERRGLQVGPVLQGWAKASSTPISILTKGGRSAGAILAAARKGRGC